MGFPDQGELAIHTFGVVHIGDGGGEILLSRQEDVFGAMGEIDFVLFGEGGNGKRVPAEGVGVAIVSF